MVDIKVEKGEIKVAIGGAEPQVAFEMSQIGKSLAERNKQLAKQFVFGMCKILSKEEMTDTVEKAFKAYEFGNAITNKLDDKAIDKLVEELVDKIFGGGKNE